MKKLLSLILVLLLAIGGLSFFVYRNTLKGSLRSGSFVIAENSYPRKVFSDLEDKGFINSGTLAATGGDGGSLNCGMDCHNCKAGNGGDAIGGSVTENGGTTTFANGSDGTRSTGEDCSELNAGSGGKSHN